MSETKPQSAADPRPNGEPYYIDPVCNICDTPLMLHDHFYPRNSVVWHDEWVCPECDGDISFDWPDPELDALNELDEAAGEIVAAFERVFSLTHE